MDLTLSNIGRTVKIKIGSINLQYLGPKNLIKFNKITNVVDIWIWLVYNSIVNILKLNG